MTDLRPVAESAEAIAPTTVGSIAATLNARPLRPTWTLWSERWLPHQK
jgi:hypothetical protein